MTAAAEHHLLFGLLALQNGLIDQSQLMLAFQAWTRNKARSLADQFVARGDLDAEQRAGVEAMVALHVKKHGDVEKSLAAVHAKRSTRAELAGLGEPEIEATLARVARSKHSYAPEADGNDDPERTPSLAIGEPTRDGQRFRLLRPHARGGLGEVFVALDAELHREVALKQILEKHADDPVSRQRFVAEAEITGGLEHPGVVPVYGLGTYSGGRPYYAMRFIKGDSLKEAIEHFHADGSLKNDPGRRTLELRKLLDRFLDVCNAVNYAHSRGVIHRDIKPANIILGKHGETLVVDWGLAKAVGRSDPSVGEQTIAPSSSGSSETLPGSALGTPAYMSPEQASGDLDRLGPRSDVYSLGATLYCLLTAKPPFEGNDIGEVLRRAERCEFAPPRRIDTSIDKALEAVCLKAMTREPELRYPSCRALAEDVERWMADEPVSAWVEPRSRTLLRWLTRHRTGVTGAAATLLAGLFGLSAVLAVQTTAKARLSDALYREMAANSRVTAANAELTAASAAIKQSGDRAEARRVEAEAQRERAEASYALARKAVDESFTQVSESTLLDVPGLRPLRRGLLESALIFYEEFLRRGGDNPALLADLAATQARVGLILADLSETGKARVAMRRAVELYDKILAASPTDVTALERQSEVWHRLGDLDYGSDRPTANTAYLKAIAIREQLAAAHAAEPRFRMALSRSLNGLAISTKLDAERHDAYRRSLELRLKLADEIPEDPDLLHGLGESFMNLGIQLRKAGHAKEAAELTRHAIDYGRAGVARRPHDLEFASDLAGAFSRNAAFCWDLGRRDEALALSTDGIAFLHKHSEDNPEVPAYRDALANALGWHGFYLKELGRTDEAVSSSRQAAGILESKPDPDVGALATAALYRGRIAGLLAGEAAARALPSWPEAARREADLAVADLRTSVARGLRRPDIFRTDPAFQSLLTRDDVKSLLAESERPRANPAPAKAEAPATVARAPSPLDRPGQLEEHRLLGEVAIALLVGDKGNPDEFRSRLETILARIEARRKSAPDSPALEVSAQSIRAQVSKLLDSSFPTDPFVR
jgi:serine/threonine protein kinase/tetratricopeptide (TPR) repeat protein